MVEAKRQGWERFRDYTPDRAIESMDQGGTQAALISCTEPGLWFGDDFSKERQEAISLTRDMNEYGARMVADYKSRFGLFAVLPLPDIDASLKEIEYAFDTLKADGVGLLTSYGDVWLGEKRLQPVFDELNRRGAIVYTHPTDAACCHNLANANPAMVEWFVDTARSIDSLLNETGITMGGSPKEASAATRYGNIKFIWSHAGGALLGVVSRVVGTESGRFGWYSETELKAVPHTPLLLRHRWIRESDCDAGFEDTRRFIPDRIWHRCPVRHVRCHRTGSGGVWAQQRGTPSHKPRKRIKNIAEIFVSWIIVS